MSDRLEGWAMPVTNDKIGEIKFLDHTFVKAPHKGPKNGPAYFDCFSGHALDSQAQFLAGGNGNYAVANCYRKPFAGCPDTADLGLYSIWGVCHQAANRFLWSACSTLFGPTVYYAKGYTLSFCIYGTYGRSLVGTIPVEPSFSFLNVYYDCVTSGGLPQAEERTAASPKGFEQRIVALHAQLHAEKKPFDHNAVLDQELKILVEEHLGPDFEFAKIREIRSRALGRAHGIATSDLRGRAFAHEINNIAVRLLDELEDHLGSENYSKLMRLPPKERYALVDPEIAERAGTCGTRA